MVAEDEATLDSLRQSGFIGVREQVGTFAQYVVEIVTNFHLRTSIFLYRQQ